MKTIIKYLVTLTGAVVSIIEPTIPYMVICSLAILADCYTAWQLDRRVKAKFGDKAPKDSGKFRSKDYGKVIHTLIEVYALIIMAYFINIYITSGIGVDITKVAAGAVLFWQLWSILENKSSCNNATWAKVAQKVLVDKTERHLNIDLSMLKKDNYEDK